MKWAYAIGLTALACADPKSSSDGGCQPGTVCILAGTGELGFNGDGLPALQTRLASPSSVYEDPSGVITIVDYSNMRVRTINDDGTISPKNHQHLVLGLKTTADFPGKVNSRP